MRKRFFAIFSVLLGLLLILIGIFFFQRILPKPASSTHATETITPPPTNCSSQNVAYYVAGKHIFDSKGQMFIPYGVQLGGVLLAVPKWQTNGALTHLTYDQVLAAHDFWHSNTVSLKIGSKALFAQSPYDKTYLTEIDQTVQWANQLGMNILLSLQYEGQGNSEQAMPTQDSIQFWDFLSKHYANNTSVFFDIFNEPRPAELFKSGDTDTVWNFWQNGGDIGGTTYVGFQQLVDTIRNNGAQNLIFADGTAAGEDIRLLPNHMLTGCNIIYAIHPYMDTNLHHTSQDWDNWFGNATTAGNFPVVADEWSEYQSDRGECLTDAPTVVPQFLSYLRNHGVGLIGYALFPGTLIRGWDPRNPTAFDQPTQVCPPTPFINLDPTAQGAGQLIEQFFVQYSVQKAV